MIAITFAVPHESEEFRRALRPIGAGNPCALLRGNEGRAKILVHHTGIGPAAAEKSAAALLREHQPRWLLSAGYAGALDPALAHGEIFLAENFTSPELLARSTARRGILTTESAAAETPAQKAVLARKTGAQAVDMETAAIARICMAHGVPLLSVRVISDTASASIPVPLHISYDIEKQRPHVFALLNFLAKNPRRIGPFARFVRGLSPARATLTKEILAILKSDSPA